MLSSTVTPIDQFPICLLYYGLVSNTPAKALLVRCSKINPNEEWRGYVEYSGQEAVMGLMANVKTKDTSENQYAMFAQGTKK